MGSTGTDHFSDYSQDSGGDEVKGKKKKVKSATGGNSGAASGVSQCAKAHGDISLEEVARCDFFKASQKVPAVDASVYLRRETDGGRLAIEAGRPRKIVGYLPTRYSYLRKCMERGYKYAGKVLVSTGGKTPIVRIDLAPTEEPDA